MTNTATTPAPEKPKSKFWIIVSLILLAFGVDHYTFHYVSGGADVAVTVTDSTISATAHIDTTIVISKADTAKKDTAK